MPSSRPQGRGTSSAVAPVMSLSIRPQSANAGAGSQTFLDVILRLMPSEVVAPHLCVATLMPERRAVAVSLLSVGALATVFTLIWRARARRERAPWSQHVIRVLSFLAWAFATGNPLAPSPSVPSELPAIAVLLIPLFGSAMFLPPSRRL